MGYRETYFNNTPSIMGKYRCVRCGGLFPKSEIDVDHRISKRMGGTDDLYNLQAMCKHCNRSKRDKSSGTEVAQTVIQAGLSGISQNGVQGGVSNLAKIGKSIATQKTKDALGIKYKRK